jgi:hypothetical protein
MWKKNYVINQPIFYFSETIFDFELNKNIDQFYSVDAVFYKWNNRNCRSVAFIKSLNVNDGKNLVVVMLNPGSCKAKGNIEFNEITYHSELHSINPKPAIADPTQKQIMELMKLCNITHTTIINLYDVIEGNSKKFMQLFPKENNPNYEKDIEKLSIFSSDRFNELKKYITKDTKVLLAWGGFNQNPLPEKKKEVLKFIEKVKGKYFSINGKAATHLHPCPRIYTMKKEWIIKACKKFYELN